MKVEVKEQRAGMTAACSTTASLHFSSSNPLAGKHSTRQQGKYTAQQPNPARRPNQPRTTTHHGAQRRKITIHALPLPRSPSSRPRNPRHKPHPAAQSNQHTRAHPDLRAMARPSSERNLTKSEQNPRPCALRLPNPRRER